MGVIHIDTGVFIALLDSDDVHHDVATTFWTSSRVRGDRIAMSATAFAECLIKPFRDNPKTVTSVRDLFRRIPIEIVQLDEVVAEKAAELRASQPSLRLPDAMVIASAIVGNADQLVTTDRKWPTAQKLGYSGAITTL